MSIEELLSDGLWCYSAGVLTKLKVQHQEDSNHSILDAKRPVLMRSLFTVGALCRHFDFDLDHFKGSSQVSSYRVTDPAFVVDG